MKMKQYTERYIWVCRSDKLEYHLEQQEQYSDICNDGMNNNSCNWQCIHEKDSCWFYTYIRFLICHGLSMMRVCNYTPEFVLWVCHTFEEVWDMWCNAYVTYTSIVLYPWDCRECMQRMWEVCGTSVMLWHTLITGYIPHIVYVLE